MIHGWQNWVRDWRLTEIRLLLLALVTAVMAVTAVSFFTDRVNRAMQIQATALLGADLIIRSSRPLDDALFSKAEASALKSAQTTEFTSMALANSKSQLVQVKVVTAGYPLRGGLEVSESLEQTSHVAETIPAPGEAWTELRVLQQLGLQPGDSISLGNTNFRLTKIITFEADRGGSAFQLAPRIMINQQDLAATGLLTPASRATFKLLVAGETTEVKRFKKQVEPSLKPYEQIQTIKEGRPEVNSAIERASRFMALASMLTVILSGVAVALAAYGFSQRETITVAVLRSLGATRKKLTINFIQRLLTLIFLATVIGSSLGFMAQLILNNILQDWLQTTLPAPRAWPILTGLATATITLSGFALPVFVKLINTPPMHILREDTASRSLNTRTSLLSISFALFILLGWQAGDFKLAGWVFLGITTALLIMLSIAWVMILLLRKLPSHSRYGWRLGAVNIGRFSRRSALLIAAFGTAFLTLTLLTTVRGDLLKAWENSVPEDAPNHFLINIQQDELKSLEAFFQERGIDEFNLYPIIRGRLTTINNDVLRPDEYVNPRAQRMASREFFLSSTQDLPKSNQIIEGQWFKDGSPGLSVESGIAETLGFGLGDRLTFDVAGTEVSAVISSLRKVQWDTMKPNFFVIASPGLLDQLPTNYITSIRVADSDKTFVTELVQKFPSITPLDVTSIIKQVRRVMNQASNAVEYVFLFTLLAGIVVLMAAIQTQRTERRQEIAILKTLGASKKKIQTAIISEFLILGAAAGLLGSLLAIIIGWVLANQVFQLEYSINILSMLPAIIVGSLLLCGVGLLIIRKLLHTSPVQLLQRTN